MPEYDPKVTTHIVTDALMRPTLRALGLKALKDIPDHIPTVKWSWVLTVIGRNTLTKEEIDAKLRDVWMHAAFSERMDAGYTPYIPTSHPSFRKKGKEKAVTTSHDEGASEPDSERPLCVFFSYYSSMLSPDFSGTIHLFHQSCLSKLMPSRARKLRIGSDIPEHRPRLRRHLHFLLNWGKLQLRN